MSPTAHGPCLGTAVFKQWSMPNNATLAKHAGKQKPLHKVLDSCIAFFKQGLAVNM